MRSVDSHKARTLLVVDDEALVIESIKRSLRREPITIVSASSGPEGLELIRQQKIHVVLSDQMMPKMDGVSFLSKVRQYDPLIVRLLLTGYASMDSAIDAINRSQIYEYLTKPWEPDELKNALGRAFRHYEITTENLRLQKVTKEQNEELIRLNGTLEKRVAERTKQLADAVQEGIVMLALASEARDDATGEHIHRIRQFTTATCLELGLGQDEADQIGFFSMMHDVGKIHIPDRILNKPGALTEAEWHIMRNHTTAGEKIMGESPYYAIARQIARSHHERIDGSGYPDGLRGDEIPLPAKIVAVVDVFDALTHERPYKKAWSVEKAIDELERASGSHFEPAIVYAFLKVIENQQQNMRSKHRGTQK